MKAKQIMIAAAEAKRFLVKVREYEENPPAHDFIGTKETGSIRRASMDLTRALADLRRSS